MGPTCTLLRMLTYLRVLLLCSPEASSLCTGAGLASSLEAVRHISHAITACCGSRPPSAGTPHASPRALPCPAYSVLLVEAVPACYSHLLARALHVADADLDGGAHGAADVQGLPELPLGARWLVADY